MIWICLVIPFALATAKTSVEPEYLDQLRSEGKDEEYAKLLGVDVSLVRPSNERKPESYLTTMVSSYGDFMMSPELEEQARQGIRFDRHPSYKWPNRRIPYVIQNGDFNQNQINTIRNAVAEWNRKVPNVKIAPRQNEADYVVVMNGNGCWSWFGKVGKAQSLSLAVNNCVDQGTVIHEFMHAAGFAHEHNRNDRDNFVNILWNNIPEQWKKEYNKTDPNSFGLQSDYDYYSIMHYPVLAPTTRNRAFEFLRNGLQEDRIGRGTTLTDIDVKKLNILYP